jgi:uncharacterized protein
MGEFREFVEAGEVAVRGFLHVPDTPSGEGLILTHGAGADCRSPLLVQLATAFCDAGLTVLRCDLPFRQARPKGPPLRTAERDQLGLRRAVEVMRKQVPGPVFLGGHSYGGRQATMLAASAPGLVEGLILLSYPLHPPKRPDQLRTAHFPKLHTPALFVQGTGDGFATIEEMTTALRLIPARVELVPITHAGHELLSKKNREEVVGIIVEAFGRFRKGAGAGRGT